jgi:hypothetical protein
MRYASVLLSVFAALSMAIAASAFAGVPEARVAAYTALELDGSVVGYVDGVQVATSDTGFLVDKQGLSRDIAALHAAPITFEVGADMGKPMYDWIKASLDRGGAGARKSGAIIFADYNYKELSRLEFTNALLTEVAFPALDAASQKAATMTVTIQPESSSRTFPRGKNTLTSRKQKAWLCSNFKFEVGRFQLQDGASGCSQPPLRNPTYQPSSAQTASVLFNPREYQRFADWQNDLFCSGLPQESSESPCTFTYLDPDGATLFTATYPGAGLFKLTPNLDDSGALVSYTAQLYVTGDPTFEAFVPGP